VRCHAVPSTGPNEPLSAADQLWTLRYRFLFAAIGNYLVDGRNDPEMVRALNVSRSSPVAGPAVYAVLRARIRRTDPSIRAIGSRPSVAAVINPSWSCSIVSGWQASAVVIRTQVIIVMT
jgi:hypothetical protein